MPSLERQSDDVRRDGPWANVRPCRWCGNEFAAAYYRIVYCSDACANHGRRELTRLRVARLRAKRQDG